MIGWFIAIGFIFGITAGLFLGLPAFVMGFLIGTATYVVLGLMSGLDVLDIALRALALAMTLQISYVLGLVAQAASPGLRQRRWRSRASTTPHKTK